MVKWLLVTEVERGQLAQAVYATYTGIDGWHFTTFMSSAWLWNTYQEAAEALRTHYSGGRVVRVVKAMLEVAWTNSRESRKDYQGGGSKP